MRVRSLPSMPLLLRCLLLVCLVFNGTGRPMAAVAAPAQSMPTTHHCHDAALTDMAIPASQAHGTATDPHAPADCCAGAHCLCGCHFAAIYLPDRMIRPPQRPASLHGVPALRLPATMPPPLFRPPIVG